MAGFKFESSHCFWLKTFLREDEMETVKANTCEVLYHNWKFNKNYWCLSFELRNKYELWNSNWTLDYVILLKVPSEYVSGNGADIISKDVEKSLIDTQYENLYSVEGSNSDSDDSESDLIYLKQINKMFKYTVFCINLSEKLKSTVSLSIQVCLSRENKLIHLTTDFDAS